MKLTILLELESKSESPDLRNEHHASDASPGSPGHVDCRLYDRAGREGEVIIGYLSADGRTVEDWISGRPEPLMTVIASRVIRAGGFMMRYGPGHRSLTYIRARDGSGRIWYGRGAGPVMSIRMHLLKEVE